MRLPVVCFPHLPPAGSVHDVDMEMDAGGATASPAASAAAACVDLDAENTGAITMSAQAGGTARRARLGEGCDPL